MTPTASKKPGRTARKPRADTAAGRDPVEEFLALADDEKHRIVESYDRSIPEGELRPLTTKERARWDRIQARLQRDAPEPVTLKLQKRLLERVDAWGADNGLTRHDVLVLALHRLLTDGRHGA